MSVPFKSVTRSFSTSAESASNPPAAERLRLGFHVRVARGYEEAIAYAQRVGCTAVQFFSGNPKTYRVALMDRQGVEAAVVHACKPVAWQTIRRGPGGAVEFREQLVEKVVGISGVTEHLGLRLWRERLQRLGFGFNAQVCTFNVRNLLALGI